MPTDDNEQKETNACHRSCVEETTDDRPEQNIYTDNIPTSEEAREEWETIKLKYNIIDVCI